MTRKATMPRRSSPRSATNASNVAAGSSATTSPSTTMKFAKTASANRAT
jgi:hypothetical protein